MSKERWQVAQSYEKAYWKGVADTIASDSEKQLSWYDWKASEFEKKLNKITHEFSKEQARVLEIGSGPIGIVSYLKWGERYALDPLSDFYKENPLLVEVRDPSVNYLTGGGEEIPFPDGHFSVVIIDNVLDHVQEPHTVLNEMHRVLPKDGILYIELNIHTAWGFMLHTVLSKLKIDKGHPYSFTADKIRDYLGKHGFSIRHESIADYFAAREVDRKSASMKSKLKGYSGLSEFIFSAVCTKSA